MATSDPTSTNTPSQTTAVQEPANAPVQASYNNARRGGTSTKQRAVGEQHLAKPMLQGMNK